MGAFCGELMLRLREQFGLRAFLGLCAAVPCLLLLGFALLFLVASLPDAKLASNIRFASEAGFFSANYPSHFSMRSLDMYTECVGIGMAKELRPTLPGILAAPHFGECGGLRAAVERDFLSGQRTYPRYIHGYQIVLKPLYTWLPIAGVRVVTALVSALLLAALFWAARRRLGFAYALLLSISFLFIRSPHVFFLVTHAVQFWVVLLGCIAAFVYRKNNAPIILFGIIGACDAFISFLSMGSLSLGLPLLCFCLIRWSDGDSSASILSRAFWASVAWSGGFLIPWFVKWGLVLALLPEGADLFGETLNVYPMRSPAMLFQALFNNLIKTRWWFWGILFVLLAVRLKKYRIALPQGLWTVLVAGLVPLIWICLLPGQSGVMHARFVHIILLPLLSALFCLLAALPPKTENFKLLMRGDHGKP